MTAGGPANIRWRYRAASADGSPVQGEIDAHTERDAVDALRRRSLWVVEVHPVGARGAAVRSTSPTSGAKARDEDLAVTIRAMSTLLGAGVPLIKTIAYAAQEAVAPAVREAFGEVNAAVQRGDTLSDAVRRHPVFPQAFGPLIAAGEQSGTLTESLALLAAHLERRAALRSKVQSALIYPLLLSFASVVGVVVILVVVVPRFATLIADNGGTLPLSTRTLIALSAVITNGWWVLALLVVGVLLYVDRQRHSVDARQRWSARVLRLPVIGHFERLRAATGYTGTLAVGLHAGVSLLGAMALARGIVTNTRLSGDLAAAEDRVRNGSSLSVAISGLLPSLTERLLDAGETGGDIAGMASRAADAADAELQRSLERIVALIEPVMILGFGGVVGFVALALLQAIYGINANVL
jgi:type II secretory pathway component PulF